MIIENKNECKILNMKSQITSNEHEESSPINTDELLMEICAAIREGGFNPVSQIVGYIMSGDPAYITSHRNARSLITKVERDELVEELLTQYINREFR